MYYRTKENKQLLIEYTQKSSSESSFSLNFAPFEDETLSISSVQLQSTVSIFCFLSFTVPLRASLLPISLLTLTLSCFYCNGLGCFFVRHKHIRNSWGAKETVKFFRRASKICTSVSSSGKLVILKGLVTLSPTKLHLWRGHLFLPFFILME